MSAPLPVRTTHDWTVIVDREHLADARRRAGELAPTGALHLICEVLAYAHDEAAETKRRGHAVVRLLADGWIEITDDGRGTDTRIGPDGRAVRKPIMATRDLRFYDEAEPPLLPDGAARRGISLVAALSAELVHENRRADGSWLQRYWQGEPVGELERLALSSLRGTVVRFLPDASLVGRGSVRVGDLDAVTSGFGALEVEIIDLS